jgi:hypothetical protein
MTSAMNPKVRPMAGIVAACHRIPSTFLCAQSVDIASKNIPVASPISST